jgi:hypothetical protein
MLQLLQYLVGTSMAALEPVAETTIVHSVVGGPRLSGSSLGLGGGKGCRFRGSICRESVAFRMKEVCDIRPDRKLKHERKTTWRQEASMQREWVSKEKRWSIAKELCGNSQHKAQ